MRVARLIIQRLPNPQSILGVYAVIVTLIYSWTLFTSFYKLPSWMFYLTIGQILSIYAYSFSMALLESIVALLGVLFLEVTIFLVLSSKNQFQARAILLVLIVLISSMLRLAWFQTYDRMDGFLSSEREWWALILPLTLMVCLFVPKNVRVGKFLDGMAERAVVFLYIYLPLSFISLAVVIFRNIY